MMTLQRQVGLRCVKFSILFFLLIFPYKIGDCTTSDIFVAGEETGYVESSRLETDFWEQRNRDDDLPKFPVQPDLRRQPSYIVEAHEILRNGLQEYLGFHSTNLGIYLQYLIFNRTEPFVDEYGQNIRNYKKVFRFIWEQYNETLVHNYAIKQLNKDKLNLCSVARYLSHQPKVEQRKSLMKRISDALRYRCHPCTPYTPKQYDETIALSSDDFNPEGISPEESLILCNGSHKQGENILNFTYSSTLLGDSETLKSNNSSDMSYNFKPCNYNTNGVLICNEVPIVEVQKVFRQTTNLPTLTSFHFILQPYIFKETIIPEDILGSTRTLKLGIRYPCSCGFGNSSLILQVDSNAFQSTRNYTKTFEADTIDCSLLDLNFLSGFDQLNELLFLNIWNIEYCLPSLPSLPSLKFITAKYCAGFNELYSFPPLTNGLTRVEFMGFDNSSTDRLLNDETVDRIMKWLLISSENTLEYLTIIYMKQVTKVPSHIPSFKALQKLYLYYNNISTIEPGELAFSAPVLTLSIFGNGIREIKPGAFQGNFKDADIFLLYNNLTRLEESVFGPILLQMALGKGFINATANPIDCKDESTCHLTWLKRFDRAKYGVTCTNDTKVHQLLEIFGLNNCSEIISY